MNQEPAMTAPIVRDMLDRGVSQARIVAELESTGVWSPSGAREIVKFMATGPDTLLTHHLRLVRPPLRRRLGRATNTQTVAAHGADA